MIIIAAALEPALLEHLPEVGRFGPMLGAPAGILAGTGNEVLAPGVAAAVCIAWATAAFAAAAALLRGRDLV